jgi:hypothetical protein
MARLTPEQRRARAALIAQREVRRQQVQVVKNEAEVVRLQTALDAANATIASQAADIATKDATIDSQEATIEDQADTITTLNATIATRDADITIYASAVFQLDLCKQATVLYNTTVTDVPTYVSVQSTAGVPSVNALNAAFPSYPLLGLSTE